MRCWLFWTVWWEDLLVMRVAFFFCLVTVFKVFFCQTLILLVDPDLLQVSLSRCDEHQSLQMWPCDNVTLDSICFLLLSLLKVTACGWTGEAPAGQVLRSHQPPDYTFQLIFVKQWWGAAEKGADHLVFMSQTGRRWGGGASASGQELPRPTAEHQILSAEPIQAHPDTTVKTLSW